MYFQFLKMAIGVSVDKVEAWAHGVELAAILNVPVIPESFALKLPLKP